MQVVDFLREYWQFIGIGLVFILIVISMVIKRKPLNEIVDNSITQLVCMLVQFAELKFGNGHGSEKLEYVLSKIKETRPDSFERLKSEYIRIIEFVLSTPKKKESVNEKVK